MSIFGWLGIPCCSINKAFDAFMNGMCSMR